MSSVKLQAPVGMVQFVDSTGMIWPIASDGSISFNPILAPVLEFVKAGFTVCGGSSTTAQRPSPAYAGQPWFDL